MWQRATLRRAPCPTETPGRRFFCTPKMWTFCRPNCTVAGAWTTAQHPVRAQAGRTGHRLQFRSCQQWRRVTWQITRRKSLLSLAGPQAKGTTISRRRGFFAWPAKCNAEREVTSVPSQTALQMTRFLVPVVAIVGMLAFLMVTLKEAKVVDYGSVDDVEDVHIAY